MKIGDVVRFTPKKDALIIGGMKDYRRMGTILGFDSYSATNETLIEVLWDTGSLDWILQSRVEVVCEGR